MSHIDLVASPEMKKKITSLLRSNAPSTNKSNCIIGTVHVFCTKLHRNNYIYTVWLRDVKPSQIYNNSPNKCQQKNRIARCVAIYKDMRSLEVVSRESTLNKRRKNTHIKLKSTSKFICTCSSSSVDLHQCNILLLYLFYITSVRL